MHLDLSPPERMVVVGPSVAYASIVGEADHFSFGLDLTLTHSILWATAGARFMPGERWTALPYGEVGLWFLVNIGVGGTVVQGGPHRSQLAPHLFIGIPFPVDIASNVGGIVAEPYYRPLWWEGNALHEVGLLFKVIAWSGQPSRRREPPPLRAEPLVDPVRRAPEPAPPAPEEPPHAPIGDEKARSSD